MPRGLCIGSISTGSFRRNVCHGSASSAGASAAAVSSGADAAVAGADPAVGADAAVVCSDRSSHAIVMMTIVMMTMTMQMGHGGAHGDYFYVSACQRVQVPCKSGLPDAFPSAFSRPLATSTKMLLHTRGDTESPPRIRMH